MTESAPFLTFLVPAAIGPDQLREGLLSLAAQTSTSFEALVVRGPGDPDPDALLAEVPPTLGSRLRVLVVDDDAPLGWLEPAVAQARGRYLAISEGLTWFAHFVESCQLHAGDGSTTLRGLVLHQAVEAASVGGLSGVRGVRAPVRRGGDAFSVLEHLGPRPAASRHGFALPRAVLGDGALRPDPELGTAALRDLLLRVVARTGVTELGEVVALSCELEGTGTGLGLERDEDAARLLAKVDAAGWQLPAGSIAPLVADTQREGEGATTAETAQLRHLVELKDNHIANIEAQLAALEQRVARLQATVEKKDATVQRLRAKLGRG
ncbi:hypothetical protein [Nocardioides houyundeii]|uniref:hypothetical protein n=1 Tax=Nocardioides houyundeii TaxID=2045452 RepID=UPI000C76D6B2|nr:hypothetical protein [Nocardioides houyundeii]